MIVCQQKTNNMWEKNIITNIDELIDHKRQLLKLEHLIEKKRYSFSHHSNYPNIIEDSKNALDKLHELWNH